MHWPNCEIILHLQCNRRRRAVIRAGKIWSLLHSVVEYSVSLILHFLASLFVGLNLETLIVFNKLCEPNFYHFISVIHCFFVAIFSEIFPGAFSELTNPWTKNLQKLYNYGKVPWKIWRWRTKDGRDPPASPRVFGSLFNYSNKQQQQRRRQKAFLLEYKW